MSNKLPFYVAVEGVDGSGKTTAVKHLVEKLKAKGLRVLETREVGAPMVPGMPELRKIILDPKLNMSGAAMEFVFAAMRVETQRFYQSVADQYDIIVSDRGWWSHLAYTTHNVSYEFVDEFYLDIVGRMTRSEDAVVYMAISQETARQRRVDRGLAADAIEAKGEGYLSKVIETFEEIKEEAINAKGDDGLELNEGAIIPEVLLIDANKTLDEVKLALNETADQLAQLVLLDNRGAV